MQNQRTIQAIELAIDDLKEYEVHLLPYLCNYSSSFYAFNLNKPEEGRLILKNGLDLN
jgi:hypothetical protein